MVSPVWASEDVNNISSDSTAWVTEKPAGTSNGDLLVTFMVMNDGVEVVTTLSGWTLMHGDITPLTNDLRAQVFYKIASNEPSSWTWTTTSSRGIICTGRITGVLTSDPINVSSDNTNDDNSSENQTSSNITTTVADTLVVFFAGLDESSSKGSGAYFTPPAGMTEEVDFEGGSFTYMGIFTLDVAAAGAVGTKTTVTADNDSSGMAIFAVSPSTAPAPTGPPVGGLSLKGSGK